LLVPGDKAKLDAAAPLANPTFTGTVAGVTKAMVGLGNVPNLDATNAANISSGTLDDARLNATVTRQGNAFNGASQLVQLDGTGKLPAVDGSQLTNLPGGGGGTPTIEAVLGSGNDAGGFGLENLDFVNAAAVQTPHLHGGATDLDLNEGILERNGARVHLAGADGVYIATGTHKAVVFFDGSDGGAPQQGAIADAAGGGVVDAEARAALNARLAALRAYKLIAS